MPLPMTYHWRHLLHRKTATLATVFVVAAVVGVFGWMLSFGAALDKSMSMANDPQKIVVLRRGSTAESNSAIPPDEFAKLNQIAEIERDPKSGELLLSPEMMVQVSLPRLNDGGKTTANVAVRGVTATAFSVHQSVELTGRKFGEGEREVIVGKRAAEQFGGLAVGDVIPLGFGGNRVYKVVGHFTAGGGPLESEIWGYLHQLKSDYNRTMYSSANMRLKPKANATAVLEQIESPAIQLTGKTEPQYWSEQSSLIRTYLMIARILTGMMGVAAAFAIANTMFSMVAGRTREIAMLRTIGFKEGDIQLGFLAEAVMLALIGGVVGCAACGAWITLLGKSKDMYGSTTFTTLAFDLVLTPTTILSSLLAVIVLGVAGAAWPARRAARIGVIDALREP